MIGLLVTLLGFGTPSIHVSPRGNDAADGVRKPVRSIPIAIARARQHGLHQIELASGEYRLTEPIRLTAADSGLTIGANRSASARILGSRRLTGWHVDGKGWWQLHLPEVAAGKWNFIQLWAKGERRFRPRLGYFSIEARMDPTPGAQGKGYDRFGYANPDLNPNWHNLHDVEVLAIHNWSMARMRIASIDSATKTVAFTGPTCSMADWAAFPKGNRYLVENVKEALGKPGSWYLDRSTGDLTYVPIAGERPDRTDIEAPVSPSLFELDGANKVNFINLRLAYTNWTTPEAGHDYPQADIDVPAAIHAANSSDVSLSFCDLAHTGGYGVEFGAGCENCSINFSRLWDLGGGGVKLGATHAISAANGRFSVRDSVIQGGGRLHPASVGVWIGDSGHNTIESNDISDFYYTGISVGWTWGYGAASSGNNHLFFNRISKLGQGVLSDMGGIYTLGDQTGTMLMGNRIFDVKCQAYGAWGIYPDEGSSREIIASNLVYDCQSAGFHQHYGQDNMVRNNAFAMNGDYEVMRTRAEDHNSFTFRGNIIAWQGGSPFGGNWSGNGFKMAGNWYWHYGGATQLPPQEPQGLVGDPGFIDPAKGDFRLKKGSAAAKLLHAWDDTLAAGAPAQVRQPAIPPVPAAFTNPKR